MAGIVAMCVSPLLHCITKSIAIYISCSYEIKNGETCVILL